MKKTIKLTALILLSTLFSCKGGKVEYTDANDYNTIIFEDCEYLRCFTGNDFTHKGNCKNKIHQYNTK